MKNCWLKNRTHLILIVTLCVMLLSLIVSNAVQTSSGDVKVKTMSYESFSGHTQAFKLYIPKNATKDTPAPAVIYAHGWYNNKENGDLFAIEFARRGYVVMAIDMYSHGNSENLTNTATSDAAYGIYDAVKYISQIPYVDADQIIVSGHSAGANGCSNAIKLDDQNGTNLIKGAIIISYDPQVMDKANDNTNLFGILTTSKGNWVDYYGKRHIALIAGQYDDYFFTVKEGSQPVTKTREYLKTPMAKAFVTFGNPSSFAGDAVEAGKTYSKNIGGFNATRVIYNPKTIHASTWQAKAPVANAVEFLEQYYPVQGVDQLAPAKQVWKVKTFFNAAGLVAFWVFLAVFANYLLETRTFESLKKETPMRMGSNKKDLAFSLGTTAVKVACSIFIVWKIMNSTMYSRIDPIFKQKNTFCIAGWAAANGLVICATFAVWYFFCAKEQGVDLKKAGLIISGKEVVKTICIALVTVVGAWAIVFFGDYFFQSDFRFWQWSVKAFTAEKLKDILPFFIYFLFFYITNSIAINVQGYSDSLTKSDLGNILLLALFNCLSPLIIIVIQYVTFTSTGMQAFGAGCLARIPTWLHTSVLVLFVTPFIARAIYKRSGNPYIGGIINAVLVTLCMCMNSTTLLGA